MKSNIYIYVVLCIGIVGSIDIHAEAKLYATYYFDERGHNTTNLSYASKRLPLGLNFWGFTDFQSDRTGEQGRSDSISFFSESRLSKMLDKHWGVQIEFNDASGPGNNVGRLGLLYKRSIKNTFFMLRFFPLETDGDGGQISFVWRRSFLNNKFFIEGFYDYNFSEEVENRVVTEPQIRYMISDQFGLAIEYRFNEFLSDAPVEDEGFAFGLHYRF